MMTSFASLDASKMMRFRHAFSTAVSVLNSGSSLEHGETLLNTDAMTVDKDDPLAHLFQKVKVLSREAGLDHLEIQQRRRGVVMTLSDKLLFQSGEAQLSSNAYPLLNKIAGMIQQMEAPVEIEGHSDDQPIRTAAFPSNWELSTARAVNVLRYLIEQQHVDAARLSAVGFSKYQPAVANDSDRHRARNRRVEIIFKTN